MLSNWEYFGFHALRELWVMLDQFPSFSFLFHPHLKCCSEKNDTELYNLFKKQAWKFSSITSLSQVSQKSMITRKRVGQGLGDKPPPSSFGRSNHPNLIQYFLSNWISENQLELIWTSFIWFDPIWSLLIQFGLFWSN